MNIQVGGSDYEIVLSPESNEDLRHENLLGRAEYARRRIRVDSTTLPDVQQETFWHEITHVISNVYRVRITEPDTDRLSHGIHQVLKQLGFEVPECLTKP